MDDDFDIRSKKLIDSPRRPKFTNVWTSDEQNKKIQGYLEVPPEFWPSIKYGTHIRYITTSGDFKPGGFILKNPIKVGENDGLMKPTVNNENINIEGKIGCRLQNSFAKKTKEYLAWNIAYEDIKQIYIKMDASTRTIVQSLEITIDSINNNMKKITEYINKMDERIKKIETKLKPIK
jgi:hypothetical protein